MRVTWAVVDTIVVASSVAGGAIIDRNAFASMKYISRIACAVRSTGTIVYTIMAATSILFSTFVYRQAILYIIFR